MLLLCFECVLYQILDCYSVVVFFPIAVSLAMLLLLFLLCF